MSAARLRSHSGGDFGPFIPILSPTDSKPAERALALHANFPPGGGRSLHRGPRRGRSRPACRSGGFGRRGARSRCGAGGPGRFEGADGPEAGGVVRRDPGDVAGGNRIDLTCRNRQHQHPPGLASRHVPCACRPAVQARHGAGGRQRSAGPSLLVEAIIKGDSSIASIAAASIVAKVVRDRLMARLGTLTRPMVSPPMRATARRTHLSVLASDGPCPFHRLSLRRQSKGYWTCNLT